MRRQGCGLISAACACLILALTLPLGASAAKPKAGKLDRGFGHGGKIIGPLVATAPSLNQDVRTENMATALGPEGTIAVAVNNTLFEYGPDGKPRRDFGKNGRLAISLPGQVLELAGVAIDAKGRTLVAGTSTPSPRESMPVPGEFATPVIATDAVVLRYSTDGRLDRSFGDNGAFVSDLGLPHPEGSFYNPVQQDWVDFTFPVPSVHLTGIALDARERPVLSGGWVKDGTECYPGTPVWERSAFAARLRPAGHLDTGFGANGVSTAPSAPSSNPLLHAAETAVEPTPVNGGVTLAAVSSLCLRGNSEVGALSRLDETGGADQGFGSDGQLDLKMNREDSLPPSIAIDLRERTLVAEPLGCCGQPLEMRLRRFSPDGRSQQLLDERRLPRNIWQPVVGVDTHARPLLLTSSLAPGAKTEYESLVKLERLKAKGDPDTSFNHGGSAAILFKKAQIRPEDVTVDSRGRILVAGYRKVKHHPLFSSFVLARFRGQ